jgi:thiol-disulfide isomerase/thioredoxin
MLIVSCKTEPEKKHSELKMMNDVSVSLSVKIPSYNFNELEKLLYVNDDKIYVVNFWATWCAPCVKELPAFEKLNSNYKNENVEVILVSLDFPSQLESKLIPFVKKKKIQSKVILMIDPDQDTWIPKVNENWSGAIPATLIYNKGKRQFYERSFTYQELNKELQTFLK